MKIKLSLILTLGFAFAASSSFAADEPSTPTSDALTLSPNVPRDVRSRYEQNNQAMNPVQYSGQGYNLGPNDMININGTGRVDYFSQTNGQNKNTSNFQVNEFNLGVNIK